MDRTSPEVLREVERVLEKKLSTLSSEDFTAAGGVDSIVEILNLVDRTTEKGIIESLEEENPSWGRDQKKMFVFEDIVLWTTVRYRKSSGRWTDRLAKALKGVDQEVQEKIFKNMSKRAATMLRRTWNTWVRCA
jgi:flagellar motor switch protein FliG